MGLSEQAISTPQAAAAQAQSRDAGEPSDAADGADERGAWAALNIRYGIADSVARIVPQPFTRKPNDPLYRPLTILTTDPTASRLDGSIARINVPYEPLQPGPEGRLFKVNRHDSVQNELHPQANLDEPTTLLKGGYDPSPSDFRFHQQMVYAVCSSVYASFRNALGRHVSWGFRQRSNQDERLLLHPFAFKGHNAYYDSIKGALCFGYAPMGECPGGIRALPGEMVYTALSHDVIAHEVTHALLDGLRPNYSVPSSAGVLGFHEGFADLVAIFQRLSCKELVDVAIRKSRGMQDQTDMLTALARQLGYAIGKPSMRDALAKGNNMVYSDDMAPHDMGSILVAAVFDAYRTIFRRKTSRYIRLATSGSGILPPGELANDLVQLLSEAASALASQFLALIIRAIDYCPPVDLQFGEYLRALITADHDLVPDDPWAYREALIDAFMARQIYPKHVTVLSEAALMWRPPERVLPAITELDFAHLRFQGDPACAAGETELRRQARALGEYATRREHLREFGLVPATRPHQLQDAVADLPEVTSIRAARRIGPDRQIVFDLVAEIVQHCRVPANSSSPSFDVYGGSTVILAPDGAIRYVISKNVSCHNRVTRRAMFMQSEYGRRYWSLVANHLSLEKTVFSVLHEPH